MSRNSFLTRVRQVASPRKMAKSRLERVQKVNKVSKSLFGPVIKSEFKKFVQSEMTKYQLQASDKWGFDFVKESPIAHTYSQFKWESTVLSDIPKFYHHIAHSNQTPSSAAARIMNDRYQLFNECENICPLSQSISSPSLVIQNPPTAVNKRRISVFVASTVCSSSSSSNQRKITDYLKVRKHRMSTTSAACLKKARAEF